MGKNYLNKDEKQEALMVASFILFIADHYNKGSLARTKDMGKYAKYAVTYARKTLGEILKPLDDDMLEKYAVDADKIQLVLKHKKEAIREYEQMKALDRYVSLEIPDFKLITNLALESCNLCEESGSDCTMKKVYIKHGVQFVNEHATLEGCPYREDDGCV